MRWLCFVLLLGCSEKEQAKDKPTPQPPPAPENLDEKMRHCPLAIDGASSTLTDVDGGVQFEVKAPADKVAEVQRRAHHIVDFAAKRHDKTTHRVSDAKGGGTMRNCPVVTSDVTIAVDDLADGARIRVSAPAEGVAALRAESRQRATKFPFVGATIVIK